MNEKNKKFNVELHINIKSYINEFKDLFLVSSTKEIFSKKFLFTQQNKDSFIISYPNINNKNNIIYKIRRDKKFFLFM